MSAKLGPYEILGPLGAGGMGEVYRARDPRFRREVAVKVLPEDFARDPERLKRFEHEARAAGALNHPNILTVHDLGSDGGVPYLVTELLEGETLRARLGRGPLPTEKALDWGQQVLRGLVAAHDKGIVHRDLKPENLFVTKDGRVKILDFGLARLGVGRAGPGGSTATMTEPGATLGTVGYMSPEQVLGETADQRSDIFAFGCVLYEMLSGHRAFGGGVAVQVMNAILTEEPPSLEEANPAVPAVLAHIVSRCLAKNPDERLQSARDLAAFLEEIHVTAQAQRGRPRETAGAWKRGLWLLPVAALLVASGVLLARRNAAREPPSFQRLTFRRGAIGSARFTTDGETVVYSAAWGGGPLEVYSLRVQSPDSRPLDLGPCDLLSMSRSDEMALALRPPSLWTVGTGTLARASLSGGAAREVLEGVTFADWAPGGDQLAIVRDLSRLEFPSGHLLYRSPGWIGNIRFSPDGKLLTFADHAIAGDGGGFVAILDRNGRVRRLTRSWASLQGLAWSADGREVWFTASETGGGSALYAAKLDGSVRLVERVPGGMNLMDIGRDGRVLLAHENTHMEVWARAPGAGAERDVSWLDWGILVDLSADGRNYLFHEAGEGSTSRWRVFLRGTDGSPAVKLADAAALAISPDAKWALCRTQTSPCRLVLVPVGPGAADTLPGDPFEAVLFARWFPDGRRVAFTARSAGGRERLYVQDLQSGPARAIGADPPGEPIIATSASAVAVLDSARRVLLCSAEGGPTRATAVILEAGEALVRMTEDGRGIYLSRWLEPNGSPARPARVYRADLQTGRRELVLTLSPADPAGVGPVILPLMTSDHRAYVYGYLRVLSDLYVVSGLK